MLKREKHVSLSNACSILPVKKDLKVESSFASNFVCKLGYNLFDSRQSMRLRNVENDVRLDEDLPDGSCFSRVLRFETSQQSELVIKSTVRKCEYIGSFLVTGGDHTTRADFVRAQLDQMKGAIRRRPVLLVISLTGVKVYSPDAKSVLMAHALRRISFATCDPTNRQFSFLAREPNDHFNQQYCHSFLAVNAKEAEELNRLVGTAFRMAYAQQLAQPLAVISMPTQPTSEALIRRGTHSSFVTALLLGSPVLCRSTCRGDASSPSSRPTARICWAKTFTDQVKHQDPISEHAMEMSVKCAPPSQSSSPGINGGDEHNSRNSIGQSLHSPGTLPIGNLWSSFRGVGNTEENSYPTKLNSCEQIKDKPPLLKNLEVVQKNKCVQDSIENDSSRPFSGGYSIDGAAWEGTQTMEVSLLNDDAKVEAHIYLPQEVNKFSLTCNEESPSAHLSDEECLLEPSSEASSKRSSRLSSNQNNPSLSSSSSSSMSDMPEVAQNSKRTSHTGSTTSSNSSVTPPPPPERHDSLSDALSEEKELRGAPWFQAGIPREIALEILGQEPVGSFMVRESTSKPGCFALSLRVPREFHQSGIAHYLIMQTNRGYKIKGFTKEFGTLTALITHHSVMPELLPCPLSLSRHNPTFKKHDSEDMMDINEDPDYNFLSDFRKMLAVVNI